MLEIVLLWVLGKRISAMARDRGRSPAGYVVLFVAMWIGCEILGGITGAVLSIVGGANEPELLLMWGCGVFGAALGAVVCFLIVNALPPVRTDLEVDPGDEDSFRPRQ